MYDSKQITQLRKSGRLKEAFDLAKRLLNDNPYDEYILNAYAWVLYSIVKLESTRNLSLANNFFSELCALEAKLKNDMLTENVNKLRPKLNPIYSNINQANELSKNGKTKEAINIFYTLKQNGQLSIEFHEAYGWALYRYAKYFLDSMTNDKFINLLKEYLSLDNEKPSMLHSAMLSLAMGFTNIHRDFNLFEFFMAWNPDFFTDEDFQEQYNKDDGKTYPSLVTRFIKTLVTKQCSFDVDFLISKIGHEIVVESIRETFFWMIINAHKENKISLMLSLFEYYAKNYCSFGKSHWNSKILDLAERFIKDSNESLFLEFFKNWDFANFMADDFEQSSNNDFANPPLVLRASKKVFEILQKSNSTQDNIKWAMSLYSKLDLLKNNTWLKRDYALFLYKVQEIDKAFDVYKDLIFLLKDQTYAWHELGNIVKYNDKELAISMFCKALSLKNDKNMTINILLDLAELFVEKHEFDGAMSLLVEYKGLRDAQNWKLSQRFTELFDLVSKHANIEIKPLKKEYFENLAEKAKHFITESLPSVDVVLHRIFKNQEGKERLFFTNYKEIEFVLNRVKFDILKNAKIKDIFEVKIYYDEEKQKYIPMSVKNSKSNFDDILSNLNEAIAVIDNVNHKKELFHYVINSRLSGVIFFSDTDLRPKVGDFIKIKYTTYENTKKGSIDVDVLRMETSDEKNSSLLKSIDGEICLKYKTGYGAIDYYEADDDAIADFAFIDDYYIPKYLLEKHNITYNRKASCKAVFNGEKWNIFEIKLLD